MNLGSVQTILMRCLFVQRRWLLFPGSQRSAGEHRRAAAATGHGQRRAGQAGEAARRHSGQTW